MKKSFVIVIVGSLFLWACEPKPNMNSLTKNMVVDTDYNPNAVFSKYSTYTMLIDTIGYYDNSDPNQADTLASGSFPADITTRVKSKMDSAGYKWVSKTSSPDLRVYIYVAINYSAYTSYNPYAYGVYGGYYGGGYSTTVTETGDLYIYIFDLTNKTSGHYLWACDIWDLISSPDPTDATILRSIDQAFKQSPYIKK